MLVKTFGAAVQGINATIVTIEVNVGQGIRFMLVGLPDNAVRESHERIASALDFTGIKMPQRQVIVNMAPADIRKEGSAYDLPLAIGILAGDGKIPCEDLDKYIIMGELSLDGGLQPIKGVLPIAIKAREEKFKGFILPRQNAREAAVVNNLDVYGVENISGNDFIVSCWAGAVWYVNDKNEKQLLLDTREQKKNTADIGLNAKDKIIYVPTFWKNSVVAYKVE